VRFGLAVTGPVSYLLSISVLFCIMRTIGRKKRTLIVPVTVIVPFELIVANSLEGFTAMGWIGSVRVTLLGTVLIIRSSSVVHV
jgi:hypothetical protein